MKMLLLSLSIVFFVSVPPDMIYASSSEIAILFSGEELGALQPCGCYEGQLGGISRRDAFIDFVKKQKKSSFPSKSWRSYER